MKTLFTLLLLLLATLTARAAVPTLGSFEPTQFDTNALSIKYRAVFTNELGVIHPAQVNAEVTLTNLNLYETFVLPAKVRLLTLGTNELDVSTNTTWLLYSPTNDATQVILSLSAGKFQGQLLFITSQNSDGAFTLPDQSEQFDTPGAYVDLQGDWIGTTNRGLILQYSAPDWIEMDRADPGSTNGPFGGGGTTINPTDNRVPYRIGATSFGDSVLHRLSATNLVVLASTLSVSNNSSLYGYPDNFRFGLGYPGFPPMLVNINPAQKGTAAQAVQFNFQPTDGDESFNMNDGFSAAASSITSHTTLTVENFAKINTATPVAGWPTYVQTGLSAGYFNASTGSPQTNTVVMGVEGSVDPANANINIGVGSYVEPGTSHVNSTNVAFAGTVKGFNLALRPNQKHVGLYGELLTSTDSAEPSIESAVLLLDSRSSGLPLIVGRTNNGTTMFKVESASGYTGTGTNFLSDDGTYKSGTGGGSPLWASSGGNLFPSPAVDVVSIESQSADNATNVVLLLKSAAPWTSGAAGIKAENDNTNYFQVGVLGQIALGRATLNPNRIFDSIRNPDLGDPDESNLFIWQISNDGRAGYSSLEVFNTSDWPDLQVIQDNYVEGSGGEFANVITDLSGGFVGTDWKFDDGVTAADSWLRVKFNASTALLHLDSADVHSSGNLVEVFNNNTNKFTLDHAGNGFFAGTLSVGSLTNTFVRIGSGMAYTNSAVNGQGGFYVSDGQGYMRFYMGTSAGQGHLSSSDGSGAVLAGNSFVAESGVTMDLGSVGSATTLWRDIANSRDVYVGRNIVWNSITNTLTDSWGSGSPEGVVTARPGSIYRDTLNGEVYIKNTGTGNTGWKIVTHAMLLFVAWPARRRKGLLVITLLLAWDTASRAATFTAASIARADVVAAIALAQDGDIVAVPAGGPESYTSCVTIAKAITLQGSGTNTCVIQDDIPASGSGIGGRLFSWATTAGKAYRMTGFQFASTTVRATQQIEAMIVFTGSSKACRLDNCFFNATPLRGRSVMGHSQTAGVVDHCFNLGIICNFFTAWGDLYGDGSWASPTELGTTNAWYLESNYFQGTNSQARGCTDGYAGGRFCFRSNVVVNSHVDLHGTETTGRYRGVRQFEVYDNLFSGVGFTPSLMLSVRSGTGVVTGNTVTNYQGLGYLYNYRSILNTAPWGGADGTNVWDNNAAGPLFTGTHTGANGAAVLTDSGAAWTIDALKRYAVQNTTQSKFGMVLANTATTATFQSASPPVTWNTGDSYAVYRVIAALDMPGMGRSDLLSGSSPVPAVWPNQQIDCVYAWDNTWNGTNNARSLETAYPMIEAVHFTNGVARPGYTPLVYPHPLTEALPVPPSPVTGAGRSVLLLR